MLPFTPEVYLSLLADYNRAIWPMPSIAFVLSLAPLMLVSRRFRGRDRIIAAILAGFWLWSGVVYHFMYFATINFVAPAFAALFVLQGLLLLGTDVIRGRLEFSPGHGLRRWVGLALMLVGYALHHLVGIATGSGFHEVGRIGTAPTPTTIFTLGLLLWTRRTPWHLLVIPLIWCLIGAAYGWFLGIYEDLSLLAAALMALIFRGADGRFHRRDAETQRRA